MQLNLTYFELGILPTNTYLGVNEETGHGFLVDPAMHDKQVEAAIQEMGITELSYILLTHGHFDHILGVNGFLKEHPEAKVVIAAEDEKYLTDGHFSHSTRHGLHQDPIRSDIVVKDGDTLPFDDGTFTVLHTPGHTAGSVCYLFDTIIFSGDTLFQMSCGRTDFEEGSAEDMKQSLQKLRNLEGNYSVLPGHGAFTQLEFERQNNPFMK